MSHPTKLHTCITANLPILLRRRRRRHRHRHLHLRRRRRTLRSQRQVTAYMVRLKAVRFHFLNLSIILCFNILMPFLLIRTLSAEPHVVKNEYNTNSYDIHKPVPPPPPPPARPNTFKQYPKPAPFREDSFITTDVQISVCTS